MMKKLRFVLLFLFTWVLWLLVSQYLLCARFQFEEPMPFEGSVIYNPYDSIDAQKWLKCNFHAHAQAWNGITNGHGTAGEIHKAYKDLDYQIHCVSNYHHIDTTHAHRQNYIPAYEHGYNLRKTHQLVLGSQDVQWLDYLFPQTLHNKQHVIQQLGDTNSVIILNHPGLRNGYKASDFSSLAGYDCMEVLNPSVISTREWDAALSAGKKTFIVGNDDIHNVIKRERLGTMCTYVNVKDENKQRVLSALRTGKSYGVVLGQKQAIDSIPTLVALRVNTDTITIKMSARAWKISMTGQNGKELAAFNDTDLIKYKLTPKDHYARATFQYRNGTTVYLNPVFYTPHSGYKETLVYENIGETTFFRTLGVIILFLWLLVLWTFFVRRLRIYDRRRLSLR